MKKSEAAEKLVLFLDQHGRTLARQSMNRQLSKLFEALEIKNVNAIAITGPSINKPDALFVQISGRGLDKWELIYMHDGENNVLLNDENKKELLAKLPNFQGRSSEIIHAMLKREGVYGLPVNA